MTNGEKCSGEDEMHLCMHVKAMSIRKSEKPVFYAKFDVKFPFDCCSLFSYELSSKNVFLLAKHEDYFSRV